MKEKEIEEIFGKMDLLFDEAASIAGSLEGVEDYTYKIYAEDIGYEKDVGLYVKLEFNVLYLDDT